MQPKIVILIGFSPNPRMHKRIDLEKTMGDLHLIYWDKGVNMLFPPKESGYTAHAIQIAASGDPVRRMIPYRRFSRCAMKLLWELQPDVVHVQGLDMLRIAAAYKKKSKKQVTIIYEVADLHRLLVDQQKNPIKRMIQCLLRAEDRRLASAYDLLLLTSMRFYEVYFGQFVDQKKLVYMPNVPDLSVFEHYQRKKTQANDFVVGYIGSVRYKQQMLNLIEAAKCCGVKLLIAGFEMEPVEIEPLCRNQANIEWIGRFDFEERACELYGKCDAIYSVYDADKQNVRVALPNKLYESVYCEVPLIVAKNTYLSQVVEEWGVGIAVDHRSVEELIAGIKQLREDHVIYQSMIARCQEKKDEVGLSKFNDTLRRRIEDCCLCGDSTEMEGK